MWTDDHAMSFADDAATLGRIVRTVPRDRLAQVAHGEWTWLDVIGHVADSAELFADRVERCTREINPYIGAVNLEQLAAERSATRDPMDCARRARDAAMRMTMLLQSPTVARLALVHETMGAVTAGHLGVWQADHSRQHVGALAEAFPPSA